MIPDEDTAKRAKIIATMSPCGDDLIKDARVGAEVCRTVSRNLNKHSEDEARNMYRAAKFAAGELHVRVFQEYGFIGYADNENAKDAIDDAIASADLLRKRWERKYKMKKDWDDAR